MTNPGRWGRRALPADRAIERISVGPLTLWITRVGDELRVSHARAEHGVAPPIEPPDDVDWDRWALRDVPHHLSVLPVFPDRPLLIKPDHSFTLMRMASARIYSRVPAWVRLQVVETETGLASTLVEVPTETLSDTWWGDFVEGSLAYWLPTKARRELRPELFEPHLIICTIQLANGSTDNLAVEQLVLRVEHLSIFERPGELWGEEVVVEYQGESVGSDIRMGDLPPREAEGAVEITPARAQSRGFRARTFARFMALGGFGG